MIRDVLSQIYPPSYEDSSGFEYYHDRNNKLVLIFSNTSDGVSIYENRNGIVSAEYSDAALADAVRIIGAFWLYPGLFF